MPLRTLSAVLGVHVRRRLMPYAILCCRPSCTVPPARCVEARDAG